MKEQDTQIPTGPIELDLLSGETTDQPADGHKAHAASSEKSDTHSESSAPTPVTASMPSETDEAPRKKKKKKKQMQPNADGHPKPKTILEQLHEFVNADEDQPLNINIHGLLGGEGLPGLFKRNGLLIAIIVVFTCCYVTCRYMMQNAVVEHKKLMEQLEDRRYKNLTLDCDLLEHTLSSRVEKSLKDSTIHQAVEQSYSLKATE